VTIPASEFQLMITRIRWMGPQKKLLILLFIPKRVPMPEAKKTTRQKEFTTPPKICQKKIILCLKMGIYDGEESLLLERDVLEGWPAHNVAIYPRGAPGTTGRVFRVFTFSCWGCVSELKC
jgi:hypothetical protein